MSTQMPWFDAGSTRPWSSTTVMRTAPGLPLAQGFTPGSRVPSFIAPVVTVAPRAIAPAIARSTAPVERAPSARP
jgi:hypothetical protein